MIARVDNYTDFQGIAELRKDARQQSPEAIKQVARQFEALFVQMMLKSMRDAVPEGGLFDSDQQRMYRDMMDKQLSLNVSDGRGLGLAAVIERQLSRDVGLSAEEVSGRSLQDYQQNPFQAPAAPVAVAHAMDDAGREPVSPGNQPPAVGWERAEDFVDDLWLHASRAGRQLGVDPEVLIAQSALETGWGRYLRPGDDGLSSYSLFGIKAGSGWQGKTLSVPTLEYRDGAMVREQARFRAYDSIGEAFRDYVDFIQSSPRYHRALEQGYDGEAYVRELQRAGYATDPDYADKILRVRHSELLETRVSELKNSAPVPLT